MNEQRGSLFAAYLLPAIIAQSMIIGGGYSTGREIVQYTGRFGPQGWLGVVIILIGFSLLSGLAFELARIGQAYDYKSWIRMLIGPLWPVFDILVVVILLLTVAVMSAAAAKLLEETVSVGPYASMTTVFVLIGFLAWKGTAFIERFKVFGSLILYAAYLSYTVLVLTSDAAPVEPPPDDVPNLSAVAVSAVQYVGYNIAIFPAVLFCLYRQTKRAQTFGAGILAGVMMTFPLALTFWCLMRFWPDERVFGAEVPWIPMLQTAAGSNAPIWLSVFGIVAGWTLLETAVGSIHAVVDRLEANLEDLPAAWRPPSGRFRRWQRTAIFVGMLAAATLLSRFGIIALVDKGYGLMAWGYILLMAIPLLTIGVVRIWRAGAR